MTWPVLNMVLSMIVAAIVAFKLFRWPDNFTLPERVGMAFIGAGSLMTIGPIMWTSPTPFEDWSGTLLRLGAAVYFVGRMLRHRYNNWAAVRQARAHFGGATTMESLEAFVRRYWGWIALLLLAVILAGCTPERPQPIPMGIKRHLQPPQWPDLPARNHQPRRGRISARQRHHQQR